MIFCESFSPPEKKPRDPKFDRRDVYIITQNALADPPYLEYIRAHYFRSAQIDPPFFQELLRTKAELREGYRTNVLASLAYNILDRPFLSLGAKIEARRRAEGVYPLKEIYTPSLEDHGRCFNEYMADAQRRLEHDTRAPNEPRQIKPGEEIHQDQGRITINGQVAVMSINALLTKVIFDHNPTNEFFVEESFPLEWMYPYLTPSGIIMKLNRQPLPELSDDILKKDHEFWSKYSDRLIGNWITYDTPVKEIADFVEKVYLQRDFSGFKGDRKFIRDDTAQKAFSKLRSSIGGVYTWRIANAKTSEEQQRMFREADFAFRQAFAFCPDSPEAVGRYCQLLAAPGLNRIDDAIIVAQTCLKLDPDNASMVGLLRQLQGIKQQTSGQANIPELERVVKSQPDNFPAAFNLANAYLQSMQPDQAGRVLDTVLAHPKVTADAATAVARFYAPQGPSPRLEAALAKLTQLNPSFPEAWYDLAALQVGFGRTNEGLASFRTAIQRSKERLAKDPKAANLQLSARGDKRFDPVRSRPEFQQLVPGQ